MVTQSKDARNDELAGRLYDFQMQAFPEPAAITLIHRALGELAGDVALKLGRSIASDPYFANRILDGHLRSFGRCMRLVVTSIIFALEEGADAIDVEDLTKVLILQLLHCNSEDPFKMSHWASRANAARGNPNAADIFFEAGKVEPAKKKLGCKPCLEGGDMTLGRRHENGGCNSISIAFR